ncbi:hypothetical protein [Streptomyces sp. NPDC001774]
MQCIVKRGPSIVASDPNFAIEFVQVDVVPLGKARSVSISQVVPDRDTLRISTTRVTRAFTRSASRAASNLESASSCCAAVSLSARF